MTLVGIGVSVCLGSVMYFLSVSLLSDSSYHPFASSGAISPSTTQCGLTLQPP